MIVAALLGGTAFAYWGIVLPVRAVGYDFTGPYEAAWALYHHAPLQVYDVPAQRVFNDTLLHLPQGPSDFRWTPPTAALLVPLGGLPYWTARYIWLAISEGALAFAVAMLGRLIYQSVSGKSAALAMAPRPRFAMTVLFCAVALSQPVTDSLRLGQSTPLLLLGMVAFTYGEVTDRPVLTGAGLALAILDKLFPVALLVWLVWRGRYRAAGATLLFIAVLVVVTLPVTGWQMYANFFAALRTYQNQPNAGPVNLSLYHAVIVVMAAIVRPGQPEPVSGIIQMASLLICVATFGVFLLNQGVPPLINRFRPARRIVKWLRRQEARDEGMFFGSSWAICSMLILEPIVWVYYYLLLLVPFVWLLSASMRADRLPLRTTVAGFAGFGLACLPLVVDPRIATPMSVAFVTGIAVRPAGLLLLWGALWWHARRTRHQSKQAEPVVTGG